MQGLQLGGEVCIPFARLLRVLRPFIDLTIPQLRAWLHKEVDEGGATRG